VCRYRPPAFLCPALWLFHLFCPRYPILIPTKHIGTCSSPSLWATLPPPRCVVEKERVPTRGRRAPSVWRKMEKNAHCLHAEESLTDA